jgi:predicted alpha/beta-fold hydrolase
VGFTTDLAHVVRTIHARFPHKRLYLCGFSLGGNVSLKLLAELGDEAPSRGLYGAAVTCVPFDPAGAQSKMDVGFNRAVYSAVCPALLRFATGGRAQSLSHTVF